MVISASGEQLRCRVAVLTFGGLHVFLGVCLTMVQVAELALISPFRGGIWPGLLIVASGAFGMAGGRYLSPKTNPRSRRCLLVSCLSLTVPAVIISTFMLQYGVFQVFFGPRLSAPLTETETACLNLRIVICLFMFNVNVGQLTATSASIHGLRQLQIHSFGVPDEHIRAAGLNTTSFAVGVNSDNAILPPHGHQPIPTISLQKFEDKDKTQTYDFKYDFIKVKV